MGADLPEQSLSVWTGTYDVVNLSDPELNIEITDLVSVGVAPIRIIKMNDGVDYMVNQLRKRIEIEGTIDLLRIHGHGGPGIQTVSWNRDLRNHNLSQSRAIISSYNFENIKFCLQRLLGFFAPNAEVWLMGCEVGAERQGRFLAAKLAKLWGVKVIAGIPVQSAGGIKTFGHESRTVTAYP